MGGNEKECVSTSVTLHTYTHTCTHTCTHIYSMAGSEGPDIGAVMNIGGGGGRAGGGDVLRKKDMEVMSHPLMVR